MKLHQNKVRNNLKNTTAFLKKDEDWCKYCTYTFLKDYYGFDLSFKNKCITIDELWKMENMYSPFKKSLSIMAFYLVYLNVKTCVLV